MTFRPHFHFLFYSADDRFISLLKSRWESQFGFCDVKKVKAINFDGSNGFLKVSRYISKYIAKPKEFCPWIFERLVEAPRRMSSKRFGKLDKFYLSNLKNYLQCKDLLHLPLNDRLDRISERCSFITLDGVKFPLPRRLKEEFFYKKVKNEDGSFKLAKSRLQVMVMDRARARVVEDLNAQLLKNSELDLYESDLLSWLALSSDEDAALRDREARSLAHLLKTLKNDTL